MTTATHTKKAVNLRRGAIRSPRLPADRPDFASIAGYWLVLAGIYIAVGANFYFSGKAKVFNDGVMPSYYSHRFRGTIIDSFPGLDASWIILGLFELAVCAALLASLLRGEFLPTKTKPFLFIALAFAMLTLSLLLFGDQVTKQYDDAAHLMGYFAGIGVMMILVMLMPPYRRSRWLGLGPR
jgi:hypothetical protein